MAREMCWGHERIIEGGIELFERDRELRTERDGWRLGLRGRKENDVYTQGLAKIVYLPFYKFFSQLNPCF